MAADLGPSLPRSATPEINAELRSRLSDLLGEYDRVRSNLAAMQQRLADARGEAKSKDGSVRILVGPRGELQELEIGPRAYRRLSPSELAAEILELTKRAGQDVQRQLEQVMTPFLPEGVTYADAMAGRAQPAAWAQQPLGGGDFLARFLDIDQINGTGSAQAR